MSDVFISYSRADKIFVERLNAALRSGSKEVWVDWEGIPPTAEWLEEIYQAIDAANTFVFVMSDESLASATCSLELAHAFSQNKRIVPLLLEKVDASNVPEQLAKLNWIMFREQDDFDAGLKNLEFILSTDLEWVKAHTRILVRAREWEVRDRDPSYLLAGSDLNEAQDWLSRAENLDPGVTQVQMAYIAASQQGMVERQQKQLRGFYIISIIYALLQSAVSYFVVFDEISEEGLMFLSPIWLLGLVFGISGLTLGKTSLKRAVIVTAIAAGVLYLFFVALWPSL